MRSPDPDSGTRHVFESLTDEHAQNQLITEFWHVQMVKISADEARKWEHTETSEIGAGIYVRRIKTRSADLIIWCSLKDAVRRSGLRSADPNYLDGNETSPESYPSKKHEIGWSENCHTFLNLGCLYVDKMGDHLTRGRIFKDRLSAEEAGDHLINIPR